MGITSELSILLKCPWNYLELFSPLFYALMNNALRKMMLIQVDSQYF